MPQDIDFANHLHYSHQYYVEQSLTHRRFKHSDIIPLIEKLKEKNNFRIKTAGYSTQGRSVNLIRYGEG
ncbi:MAG: hypothetical protein P4L45_02410, partial [Ignavibacteriaceae bacterium]|nr:hypothetical protein [Ignavibacteriaceae bacterium]